MPSRSPSAIARLLAPLLACGAALACAACGSAGQTSSVGRATLTKPTTTTSSTASTSSTNAATTAPTLPGTGKPAVVIGDKNFTEQFVLGELYYLALQADGFSVTLNRNIGPTAVTIQALTDGTVAMYPEYLQIWNSDVAGCRHPFRSSSAAYQAAQRYALAHGLELLNPTPFNNTDAIAVTVAYAAANHLRSIGDLSRVAQTLTIGGPAQFQQDPGGLPALQRAYGLVPAAFKPLAIGNQYPALDQGTVQAADVQSTDGQLAIGDYVLLKDPSNVFGAGNPEFAWGHVVPVVSAKVIDEEGPAFAETINKVSALLTTATMRDLNMLVDVAGQDPASVARQFLEDHGVLSRSEP
jgi:osmoprotectant transport system substrate-binding protein